jgi:hypothetical protein
MDIDIAKKLPRIAFGSAFPRAGRALVLAAVCAFAYRANSEVCYYLPNGTGAWADSSRWKNGKVPAENDKAEISDGTAYVTDADSEVVARVGAITLQSRTAVIEFNVENDFHVPNRIIGKGKIVKKGKGRLFLDAPYENFYYTTEGIEVNDGELYLVERPAEEIPGGQIDKKLGQVKGKGNEGDLFERDLVEILKGQKEQRRQVADGCHGDVDRVAGSLQSGMIRFHFYPLVKSIMSSSVSPR